MSSDATLVTGASGFVGRHLVDRLVLDDRNVAILVRTGFVVPRQWLGRVTVVTLPNWNTAAIGDVLGGLNFDRVFHLAAYGVYPDQRNSSALVDGNVDLPLSLAEFCHRWGASLVATGSSAEYASVTCGHRLLETDPLMSGASPPTYATTKTAGGLLLLQRCAELRVRSRYLRLFNVYGPGEASHRLLPSLAQKLLAGETVPLSAGNQIRDFVYVEDVVDACLRASDHCSANSAPSGAVWNVCSGQGSSVRQFATMVAAIMGVDPERLRFGALPMRQGELDWLVGSAQSIEAAVGWKTRYDLRSGIGEALKQLMPSAGG